MNFAVVHNPFVVYYHFICLNILNFFYHFISYALPSVLKEYALTIMPNSGLETTGFARQRSISGAICNIRACSYLFAGTQWVGIFVIGISAILEEMNCKIQITDENWKTA